MDIVIGAVAFLMALAPVFHVVAYVFTQIWRRTVIVAYGTIARHIYALVLEFGVILIIKVFLTCRGVDVVVHLAQHDVATAQGVFGIKHRAV